MSMRRENDHAGSPAPGSLLADLYDAPYSLSEPAAWKAPMIFASPHSGRLYPEAFLNASRLSPLNLRRSEDAYVDLLLAEALSFGAPLLCARFPRAYVDANRAPGEIDVSMLDGESRIRVEPVGPRVNAGLGVIPRVVRDGAEIYRGKLKSAEVEERLARLHRPYHVALAALVRQSRAVFSCAVVVDCHSMPSAAGAPDIVLGDRYGTAASPVVLRQAENAFLAEGFSVGRNVPYAGGYTTHVYGEPSRGIHALQIEINRALYLDEERIEMTAAFDDLKQRLTRAMRALAAVDRRALQPPSGMRFAAE